MTKEAQIEDELIKRLVDLKYEYRKDIRDKQALELNFRHKFNALNRVNLTDSEFDRLKDKIISSDVFETSKRLREKNSFTRDDGTPLHYSLVNIKDWCKNEYEVINQLRINTSSSHHRYDVILLINGLPLVQIELKTLQVSPRKAIQQIVDYKTDPGNGYSNTLLSFMQLFIVSNRTTTYYFSNNNNQHFSFNAEEQFLPIYQLASEDNKKITHLNDFTDKFLAKCTLGQMISRYMVLVASEQKILVMRPYQVYAVKAIVDCIHQNRGNGYIWHTTGSGKTLTSFKASTLLKDNPEIEKCLFVVDRKDLDRQTREEFNKFQENSVEENTNTKTLVDRMLSADYANKVIVTTIQKLGLALDPANKNNYKEQLQPLSKKRIVFIFDECHRSQFGENHKAIKEFFPNSQLFGFTGTPIFEENASYTTIEGEQASFKTTQDVFQKELHSYTITNAIDDKNVLRFHVDYLTLENTNGVESDLHKIAVVDAIIKKHDAATNDRRFNALLATSSIKDAIQYYDLFKKFQAEKQLEDDQYKSLNIACVFSPPVESLSGDTDEERKNKADVKQLQDDLVNEKADTSIHPEQKKEALIQIIKDYNTQYGTNHTVNKFDLYYQNVQQRIKDQKYSNSDYAYKNKVDVVIVVDMLLTGFDSKYLNTLYVDKNLKMHGLIQAFSRTNRILNDTKPYGNILDFRQQEDSVNKAITLFSGVKVDNPKEIWLVDPAATVMARYQKATSDLEDFMKSQNLACIPSEINNLRGDLARGEFISHFKEIQRLKTQLDQYTDLKDEQMEAIESIINEDDLRSFRSVYLDLSKSLKSKQKELGDQAPIELQQLDFEFVLFSSAIIDYDYIMGLLAMYTQDIPSKQKMTREQLINLLSSSANLMEERDDIVAYVNTLKEGAGLTEEEIRVNYQKFKAEKSAHELKIIASTHGLAIDSLRTFVDGIMNRMIFDGEQLTDLLAPLDLGWKDRRVKELALMEDLVPLLKKRAEGREIAGLVAYE